MRQVIFDTETTGFSTSGNVAIGHRIVEIGCIELEDRRLTGRHFHYYLNPEQMVDDEAIKVHGLNNNFLIQQPTFAQIADELWQYLDGVDELIAHNMSFDQTFINHELSLMGDERRLETQFVLIDTLTIARQMFPAQKNNLDALCRRFGIDNSKRELHGALLDAQLLAEVYLKLTGGQSTLTFEQPSSSPQPSCSQDQTEQSTNLWLAAQASSEELAAHQAILTAIRKI